MQVLALVSACLLCYVHSVEGCTGLKGIPSVPVGGGGLGGGGHGSKEKSGRCLHRDSKVLMADGRSVKKAGDLLIGDRVWSDDGESTAVILTPATEIDEVHRFVSFKTKRGLGTILTPDHAVFARPCDLGGGAESWPIKRSGDLLLDDCVPAAGGGEDPVVFVGFSDLPGRVHPITANGRIAVDGVLVSCYDFAGENSTQEERHAPLEPARALYSMAEKIYYSLSNEQYALGVIDSLIRGTGLEKFYYQ